MQTGARRASCGGGLVGGVGGVRVLIDTFTSTEGQAMSEVKKNTTRMNRYVAACGALATAAAAHGQFVIYVDDDASKGGDGSSWENALDDLQDGLLIARVLQTDIEIRVAGGNYLPSQSGNRARSFDLDSTGAQSAFTLTIKGAFRGLGGGGNPSDRNLTEFVTVLNGDLDGNDEAGFVNYRDNSRSVLTLTEDNMREGTVLDGLVIRGGYGSRGSGAVLHSNENWCLMVNCVVVENWGDGDTVDCEGKIEIRNSMFARNRVRNGGGGVAVTEDYGVVIDTCTFVDNLVGLGAALASEGVTFVTNSVLAGFAEDPVVIGSADVRNSCMTQFYPGRNNIIADPLFVDREGGDYRLQAGSPCIDAGDTRAATGGLFSDLAGGSRLLDDPATPDSGIGDRVIIDMGAYEYQGCKIDLNEDGMVNTIDILTLLNLLADGCP